MVIWLKDDEVAITGSQNNAKCAKRFRFRLWTLLCCSLRHENLKPNYSKQLADSESAQNCASFESSWALIGRKKFFDLRLTDTYGKSRKFSNWCLMMNFCWGNETISSWAFQVPGSSLCRATRPWRCQISTHICHFVGQPPSNELSGPNDCDFRKVHDK